MDDDRYNDLKTSTVARLAAGGVLLTGWIGIILAINSMIVGDAIGAGICLAASALAFGFVINRRSI
ncbi:MAG: hypothetical protein ACXAEU_18015 [Candidatus Hodarchaeales archaeon]